MSRCGRSIDLLSEWRDHPRGCTAEHGWADGYDGPCTDDAWDIVQSINQIDTEFRTDKIARLEKAVTEAFAAGYARGLWDVDCVGNEPPDEETYLASIQKGT